MTPRTSIRAADRKRVFERDDFTCRYCGHKPKHLNGTLHIDHVYPVSRGGINCVENYVTACAACNLRKHNSVWVPEKVQCTLCALWFDRPVGVQVDPWGVWFACDHCDDVMREGWRETIARDLELDEFSDLAMEQAHFDRLILAGHDV